MSLLWVTAGDAAPARSRNTEKIERRLLEVSYNSVTKFDRVTGTSGAELLVVSSPTACLDGMAWDGGVLVSDLSA